jgi:hypothetical protein
MDTKMKYCLVGAVLSGLVVLMLGYLEVMPQLTGLLKAVYLFFTVGFTICMYRSLLASGSSTQTESAE